MLSHPNKPHKFNHVSLYLVLMLTAAVISMVMIGCNPRLIKTIKNKEYVDELARRWAPVHYQDVDPDGTWSLGGRSDYITAVDYDGDWSATNNWDDLESGTFPAIGQAYYSVVLSRTHAFIIYAFYHPRDWSQFGIPQDAHENDLEGILAVIKLPGIVGSGGYDDSDLGTLMAIVTICHNDFYSYTNQTLDNDEKFTQNGEDIDGAIHFEEWEGEQHPVTAQQSGSHCLKAWPDVKIKGGDGLRYYPVWDGATEPGGVNDRNSLYNLVDIFADGGLWARRNNTETFSPYGSFNGNNYSCCAHAPWAWDDHNDQVALGAIATDPADLVSKYFGNLGKFHSGYIYNPYRGIDLIIP
jgi:hypothetical protein